MPQARRLLATLSTIPAASARSGSGTFVPPYAHAHAQATPSSSRGSDSSEASPVAPALRPPYSHNLDARPSRPNKALNAPYKYTLPISRPSASSRTHVKSGSSASTRVNEPTPLDSPHVQAQTERWLVWARTLLQSGSAQRDEVIAAWNRTLEGLEHAAASEQARSTVIPQVGFQGLSAFLADPQALEAVRSAGTLVVRDVVPDEAALDWARQVALAMKERGGAPTYWHPALLSARSNPSLLTAVSAALGALTPYDADEALLLAEGIREGLGSGAASTALRAGSVQDAWAMDETTGPSSPLHAHLALTPSSTPLNIPSSIHSATYTLLRPLFRPLRSRISFYSSAEYLASSNWTPIDATALSPSSVPRFDWLETSVSTSTSSSASTSDALPHLVPSISTALSLSPGDLILRNPGIPTQTPVQAFLPLSLLPRTRANETYVQAQREAYEAGLPPPTVALHPDAAVRVEETEGREGIQGWRGKKVMGY